MIALSDDAVDLLAAYGLSPREYLDAMTDAGMPVGSACGCPDSRCFGHHHGDGEDCGCLRVFAEEITSERHKGRSGT